MFDMLPFSSDFATFEMTGEEIVKMIIIMQEDKYINSTSGIVQRLKRKRMVISL